jgi:hypothetical protein
MGKRILGISIALILIGLIGGVGLIARTPIPKPQIQDAAMGVMPSESADQKSTPTSSLDDLSWAVMNPMPTARYGAITGFYGGKIFVAGGASDTTHPFNTGVVQAFDVAAATWSSAYNVNPNARRLAGSGKVQVGSKLYIIGGIAEAGVVSGQVDCYDMATNTWSTLPNPCIPRYAHGVAVVGTDIYVYGGFDGIGVTASTQKLNTLTNIWSTVAAMPSSDGWLAGAAANGKAYAFGGAVNPSRVLEYDPGANTWTTLANMPQSRVYASAVAEGTTIYLAGGESAAQGGTARLRAYSFNAITLAWVDLGSIPASRVWPAVASSGAHIYIIGGLDRTLLPVTFTNTCWRAPIAAPGAPGPVTGLQVTIYNDPMGTFLQWVNPAVDDQGSVLTDLDSIVIVRYSCTDTVRLGRILSPTIGAAATFMDNQIETIGAYQWKVTPYNSVNVGAARYVAGFVGTEGTYTWEPATYSWTDISGIGTPLNITVEDEVVPDVPLGFTFNFYGGNYSTVNISENGWLSFESTGGYYINQCLPESGEPNNAIYPFFDDLSIEQGGDIYYYSDGSKFVVQWQNVGFYDATGVAKFQVIIWASGAIDFIYNTAFTGPVNSATVGIEDATGANYLQLCCNGAGTGCPTPGAAYRLDVACPGTGSISGTVVLDPSYGGNVTNVTITTDNGDVVHPLATGEYELVDIDAGTVTLTATLTSYDSEITQVYLPVYGELNNVDFTLVRSAPSPVTTFSGKWSYVLQATAMSWGIPSDTTIHHFNIYRCPPNSETYTLVGQVPGDQDTYEDPITAPAGIYHYYVTSVDIGPSVDRESTPSEIISPSVGTLPTYWLTCDGYYDDRVCLEWYRPNDSPVREYYYDDGGNDVGGLGFWDAGYYAVRFTFVDSVTVYGLRYYWTDQAAASTHDRLLIWQANATGMPGTLLYNVSANRAAGEDAFVDYALATPLQIPSGDFFVGAYQASSMDYLGLGGDDNPESFLNDTYFYSLSGDPDDWATFESDLFYYTPMIRVYAGSPTGLASPIAGETSGHSSITSESGKDAATGAVLWLASPVTSRDEVNVSAIGAVRPTVPAGDFTSILRFPRHAPAKASWLPPDNKEVMGHLDEPDNYYVYKDGVLYHTIVRPESTMFCDESVGENEQHTYMVKAVYYGADTVAVGLESVTCMANMAPGTVSGIGARFSTYPSCSIELTWDQVAFNADGSPCIDLAGYRIYLDGVLLEEIPPDILEYSATIANPQLPHVFAISAVDEVPNEGAKVEIPVLCEAACNYNWVELEGDPDAVEITDVGDDDNLGFFPIGFPFDFYGVTYELFRFAANGFITFESTSGSYDNDCPLPTANEPNGAIYPLWDDFFPPAGGTFWYKTDAANERLIIEWSEVPYLSLTGTATFEVILYAYGGIQFQYKDVAHFESATIGIENQAGDLAIEYCCNGDGIFCPISQWSICTGCFIPGTLEGTIFRGNTALRVAGAVVEDMETGRTAVTDANGDYSIVLPCGNRILSISRFGYCDLVDTIVVACDETTTQNFRLYWPKIQITPGIVSNNIRVGVTSHDTLRISNPQGTCPLSYTIAMDPVIPWIQIDPDTATVAQNQTQNVILTYTPPVGANPHVITMLHILHNADTSPDTAFVDLRVLATDIRQAGTPEEFAVHQNFPNPFNPTTSIFFDLPTREHVRVDVFNVIGQKVATLMDEPLSAGYHVVNFDASGLPTGLYFYRVQAGEWSALKKMMLVK